MFFKGIALALLTGFLASACASKSTLFSIKYKKSIVRVFEKGQSKSGGTGFVIKLPDSGKKVIITNRHVCSPVTSGEFNVGSKPIMSKNSDICIITRIDKHYAKSPALPLEKGKGILYKLDDIFIVGYPFGQVLVQSAGRAVKKVAGTLRRIMPFETHNCIGGVKIKVGPHEICEHNYKGITSTALAFPGNSGSPVFNEDGKVVGIVSMRDLATNFALHIGLERIKIFIAKVAAKLAK